MTNQEIYAHKVAVIRYRRKLQMRLIARKYDDALAKYMRAKEDIPRHTTDTAGL